MKAKVGVTYNLNEIPEGLTEKEIDEFIIKIIEMWGGKWYAQGSGTDKVKDVCFDLEIVNEPLLRIKQ